MRADLRILACCVLLLNYATQAIEFHRYIVLRRFLRKWQEAREHILMKKIKWQNAIVHCHEKLSRKIWLAWIEYCNVKIERTNRLNEMRAFYTKKLIAKSLKRLSSNAYVMIEGRRNFEKATNHYVKRLSRRFFHAWTGYHREKVDYENKVSIHRGKIDNSSKRNIFKNWRLYVWRKKCFRRKNNTSTSHYNRKLMKNTIFSLKSYLSYRNEKSIRLCYLKFATARISLNILAVHVEKWRIAVLRIAQYRQKILRAEQHWRLRQNEKYFFIWKQFSKRYKLKSERKDILNVIGNTVLLKKYTNIWLKKYQILATIRAEETRAFTIYGKKIKQRLFRSWKRYVDGKIARKIEIDEARKFHRVLLLRESLKETLKICLYKSEMRYETRMRCARKNSIEDFDTLRKFFAKWLSFVCANDHVEQTRDRPTGKGNNRKIYEFPFAPMSTRLVLPEYMLKKMRTNDCDNYDFHEEITSRDTCNDKKLEKTYLSSCFSRYKSTDDFSSNNENTTDLSTGIYSN